MGSNEHRVVLGSKTEQTWLRSSGSSESSKQSYNLIYHFSLQKFNIYYTFSFREERKKEWRKEGREGGK